MQNDEEAKMIEGTSTIPDSLKNHLGDKSSEGADLLVSKVVL